MKEISIVINHMIDAKSSLTQAALTLKKVKPNTFDPTIKEIKETIGDLSCSISVLQQFIEQSELKKGYQSIRMAEMLDGEMRLENEAMKIPQLKKLLIIKSQVFFLLPHQLNLKISYPPQL